MENYAFPSQGLPGRIGEQAQTTVRFLNTGGASTTFNEWNAQYNTRMNLTQSDLKVLESRSDRTQRAIPPERIKAVRDLIPLLQAQAPVIERAFQLIEMPDAWQEQDLAQVEVFSENRLPKGHPVAKRLRERREIEIDIAQVQELLRDSSAASDNAALLDRWKQLFKAHMQKSQSIFPSPALLRSKDLLILTWSAAIDDILIGTNALLEQPSWNDEQRTQAQELVSMIEIAEGRLAKLTDDTADAFKGTESLRQRLADRLEDRSISPMSTNDSKKTLTGNATGGDPPQAPVPPIKPAGGPPSDEHAKMEHYTNNALSTAKDIEIVAKLAKPFLNGSRQPANDIEQNFMERVEQFIAVLVDPLIERTAVAGRITRNELNEAISHRELFLAAVEQFRGPEVAEQVSKCLDKESLKLQATNLLSAPRGSWYDSNLVEAQQLTEHPQMQGTPLLQELIERIADETRIANDARDAERLVHATTWADDDAAKAQTIVNRKLLEPSVIETLRQRLTPPPSKTPTPPPPPPKKPKTTDTVVLSKDGATSTPWWKQSQWLRAAAAVVAVLSVMVISATLINRVKTRRQLAQANQAALAAAPPSPMPATPSTPPPVNEPAPQADEPAPAESPAPNTEPVAEVPAPAPTVVPTNEAPAPSPANPPVNEPAPAVANPPTERALTRADFGGHPINRVPDDARPRGSWIGAHLRCTTPPTTNNNGLTNYRTCRYVE